MIRVVFQTAAGEVECGPFEKVTLGGINADLLVAGNEILATHTGRVWELPDGTGVGAIEFMAAREEIMKAVNAGADLTMNAMDEAGYLHDETAANVANLVVCAIGTVLDMGEDATIVDVLVGNFEGTIEQWRSEVGDEAVDAALEVAG
jgi:hypothetical protein